MPKSPREHEDPATAARAALHRLGGLSPRERACALAEVILCCDAVERSIYFPALAQLSALRTHRRAVLERFASSGATSDEDFALACLVKCFVVLEAQERELVLGAGEGRWELAAREAMKDARPSVHESVAMLACEAGDTSLAGVAADLLASTSTVAAERAELALVAMAVLSGRESWIEEERESWEFARRDEPWRSALRRGWMRGLEGGAGRLDAALDRAIAAFGVHRRRGVLLALMLRAGRAEVRRSSRLRALVESVLTRAEHPAHDAMMTMLRLSRLPIARLRALEWLAAQGAGRASMDRLARAESRLDHELVLSSSHLAWRWARARVLGETTTRAVEMPAAVEVPRLTAASRRMLARWCSLGERSARERERVVAALLHDEDAGVRAACVARGPRALLLDFVLDEHACVSRSALVTWLDARESVRQSEQQSRADTEVLKTFTRMPHATVRALARLEHGAEEDERRDARVRERRDPAALLESLRVRLASREPGEVVRSLAVARRLGVVDALEGVLREVYTRSSDDAIVSGERVRAGVIAALGDARTPVLADLLRDALHDADARVRACAVESLARRARRGVNSGTLTECKPLLAERLTPGVHHRERANALRACIEGWIDSTPGAPDDLLSMLTDERPSQRLAAAWLAGRVLGPRGPLRLHPRLPALLACVAEAGRFDVEPKVRVRASRSYAMIEGAMTSWSDSGMVQEGAHAA